MSAAQQQEVSPGSVIPLSHPLHLVLPGHLVQADALALPEFDVTDVSGLCPHQRFDQSKATVSSKTTLAGLVGSLAAPSHSDTSHHNTAYLPTLRLDYNPRRIVIKNLIVSVYCRTLVKIKN